MHKIFKRVNFMLVHLTSEDEERRTTSEATTVLAAIDDSISRPANKRLLLSLDPSILQEESITDQTNIRITI